MEATRLSVERDKGNGKIFPAHIMKAYRGSRSITPLTLNLCSRSCRFTPGKEPQFPLNRRLYGGQNRLKIWGDNI
jgi:hypothetical protein